MIGATFNYLFTQSVCKLVASNGCLLLLDQYNKIESKKTPMPEPEICSQLPDDIHPPNS